MTTMLQNLSDHIRLWSKHDRCPHCLSADIKVFLPPDGTADVVRWKSVCQACCHGWASARAVEYETLVRPPQEVEQAGGNPRRKRYRP